MKIRVVKTMVQDKGKYQLNKVTYRNLESGKVMSANVPDFKAPKVWETFTKAQADECYEVNVVKDGEYWTWESATKIDAPKDDPEATVAPAPGRKGTSVDRDWESKAERAARQILIVRQSSVSAAQAFGKEYKDVESLLAVAGKIENWVLRGFQQQLTETSGEQLPLDVAKAMKDIMAMKDDVPA